MFCLKRNQFEKLNLLSSSSSSSSSSINYIAVIIVIIESSPKKYPRIFLSEFCRMPKIWFSLKNQNTTTTTKLNKRFNQTDNKQKPCYLQLYSTATNTTTTTTRTKKKKKKITTNSLGFFFFSILGKKKQQLKIKLILFDSPM